MEGCCQDQPRVKQTWGGGPKFSPMLKLEKGCVVAPFLLSFVSLKHVNACTIKLGEKNDERV